MLALTDSRLAHLAIAATRMPVHKHDRWLQRLAEKLDPPPKPVTRQGRWRQRKSA